MFKFYISTIENTDRFPQNKDDLFTSTATVIFYFFLLKRILLCVSFTVIIPVLHCVWDPMQNSFKDIFFKYSRLTYQKTRIGTPNSNIESNFINVENSSIGKRKTMLYGISQLFYCLCSQFSNFLKIDSIFEFSIPIGVF